MALPIKRRGVLFGLISVIAASALAAAEPTTPDLRSMLMAKFEAMNVAQQGIFHEDITPNLAPYFPAGQTMADTLRIVADQKLGTLQKFMGTNDPGMGTMYVTRFDLTSRMFSRVYVVIDFDFDDASAGEPRLKQMKAYLRAANM